MADRRAFRAPPARSPDLARRPALRHRPRPLIWSARASSAPPATTGLRRSTTPPSAGPGSSWWATTPTRPAPPTSTPSQTSTPRCSTRSCSPASTGRRRWQATRPGPAGSSQTSRRSPGSAPASEGAQPVTWRGGQPPPKAGPGNDWRAQIVEHGADADEIEAFLVLAEELHFTSCSRRLPTRRAASCSIFCLSEKVSR